MSPFGSVQVGRGADKRTRMSGGEVVYVNEVIPLAVTAPEIGRAPGLAGLPKYTIDLPYINNEQYFFCPE